MYSNSMLFFSPLTLVYVSLITNKGRMSVDMEKKKYLPKEGKNINNMKFFDFLGTERTFFL